MIVIMNPDATASEISKTHGLLQQLCLRADISVGQSRTVFGLIGDERPIDPAHISTMPGVNRVVPVEEPYRLVALKPRDEHTVIYIGNVPFGRGHVSVIGGPCAVESLEQMLEAGRRVQAAGASVLRGEAYKPRTSPYSFQGLREEGLKIMRKVSNELEMPFVAEVVDAADLPVIIEYADAIRIGTRNMQNFSLLSAVGAQALPVILKRGLSATYEEWLMSAEYIAAEGNSRIILCERGIRTFEAATRNTPDIAAIPMIQSLSHLPIIFDPSHGVGIPSAIPALAQAGLAAGADGLMIDVHPNPSEAKVDGAQALTPDEFDGLMATLKSVAPFYGKQM